MISFISSVCTKRSISFLRIGAGAGFLLLLLLPISCSVSKSELTRAKTIAESKDRFAADPFGFELTLGNFEAHYGKLLKRQRYFLESPVNKNYTDTIYRFYKGKTNVLFYKPMKLEAKLMTGRICKPEIELRNEIRVGLNRKEFFWKFTDWVYDSSDSLMLDSPAVGGSFVFVFSHDKLKTILITNKQYKK